MAEVEVRALRPGDGAGCARAWLDAARYYVDMEPENFQMPAEAGLADWFEQEHGDDSRPVLRLVATVGGQVAGFVLAVLEAPLPDARWQMVRAVAGPRVYVNALMVAESYRRAGAGTALMAAVERWGREHGAVLVALDTNLRSKLSVPFYEDRLGYVRHAVIFRKYLS
jgi:GNAT superfamily N-acetyltransferase